MIPPTEKQRLGRKYKAITTAMLLLRVGAELLITGVLGRPFASSVFWIEALAVWTFAFYWFTKTGELRMAIDQPAPPAAPSHRATRATGA